MNNDMNNAKEERRKIVTKSLAISDAPAPVPTKAFMRALGEYIEGALSLEQLDKNIDAMMYIEDDE